MKKTHKQHTKAIAMVLHNVQQQAVVLLFIFTIISAVLYIYFLGSAVVYAVERKEAQSSIADTNSRVADLEVDYLKGKNSITMELATSLGFTGVVEKDYVTRARYLGRADTQ